MKHYVMEIVLQNCGKQPLTKKSFHHVKNMEYYIFTTTYCNSKSRCDIKNLEL